MLGDAAAEDVVLTEDRSERPEVLFPIFLPDSGAYDWVDWFLKDNPSRYLEVSDRSLQDWALKSGFRNEKGKGKGIQQSNDKPEMGFGIPSFEDGAAREILTSMASMQHRNSVSMQVRGNLCRDERIASLKKWGSCKKVAQVMIGVPDEAFRKRTHELMLADKQEEANREWYLKNGDRIKQMTIAKAARQAEKARKSMEREQKRKADAENGGGEENNETKEEEVKKEEEEEDEEEDKMDVDEEKPPLVELSPAEKQAVCRQMPWGDLSQSDGSFISKFCLPGDTEGFDEIRYAWSSREECEEHLQRWVRERKASARLEDLQPSSWFHEKWQEWQRDLQSWHAKHVAFKDPNRQVPAAAPKAATPAVGAASKAPPAQKPEENKEGDTKENGGAPEESKDPADLLEEEIEREEDADVFNIDDVCDIDDGNGTPLFSNFAFEDWALLSLRFELHLLVHAFLHDCEDPDRVGILPDHLAFYYNKYYKKALNPQNYGVESVDKLTALVKDTAVAGARSKAIESMVAADLDSNEIFVKLTEESRRDRQRRIDSGDTSAQLKFSRPTNPPAAPPGGQPFVQQGGFGMPGGCPGGFGMPGGMPGMFSPPPFGGKMGAPSPVQSKSGSGAPAAWSPPDFIGFGKDFGGKDFSKGGCNNFGFGGKDFGKAFGKGDAKGKGDMFSCGKGDFFGKAKGKDFGCKDSGGKDFGGNNYGGKSFGGGKDKGGKDFGSRDFGGKDFGGKGFGGKDFNKGKGKW